MVSFIALIICVLQSRILAVPFPSQHHSGNPPLEYANDSDIFNHLSPLPEAMNAISGDVWTQHQYGRWASQDNAHYLEPKDLRSAGLPYPTSRSRECAQIIAGVKQGVLSPNALRPYVHPSLHDSLVPQTSNPSVNRPAYEEEQYEDAEDGTEAEVNQYTDRGEDWQVFNELGDLPEGNLHRNTERQSFRHEQEFGGLLDAIPQEYLRDGNDGERQSVHYNTYAGEGHDPLSNALYQNVESSGGRQSFNVGQQTQLYVAGQDHNTSAAYATNPSENNVEESIQQEKDARRDFKRQLRHQKTKKYHDRHEAEMKMVECLHDAETMQAWEVYKVSMNAPMSDVNINDAVWKQFMFLKTPSIINHLNSGDPQRIHLAKVELSAPIRRNQQSYGVQTLSRSQWSAWAQEDNGKTINKYLLKIYQLCNIAVSGDDSETARKYWRDKLLLNSNWGNMHALRYGSHDQQMQAIAELAGKTFAWRREKDREAEEQSRMMEEQGRFP